MGPERHEVLRSKLAVDAPPARPPWPPAVRAILWLDVVLLAGVALAVGGKPPALGHGASAWTWIALGGSMLTAVAATISAFELSMPGRGRAWVLLPAPAFVLWIGASGLGCLALPSGTEVWGDTLAEAGECLRFLLAISLPLLALILFMLWWSAPRLTARVQAMGAIASAAAAATLLVLVHPHDAGLLDLGAHALAIAVLLGISALAARIPPRK